jgi:hypothetical protein
MSLRRILRGTGANNLKAALRCRLWRVGLWGTAHPPPLPPIYLDEMREGMRCHRQTQLPKRGRRLKLPAASTETRIVLSTSNPRSHSPRNLLTDLCLAKLAQRAFVSSSVRLHSMPKKVVASSEETQSPFISTSFHILRCQFELGCCPNGPTKERLMFSVATSGPPSNRSYGPSSTTQR